VDIWYKDVCLLAHACSTHVNFDWKLNMSITIRLMKLNALRQLFVVVFWISALIVFSVDNNGWVDDHDAVNGEIESIRKMMPEFVHCHRANNRQGVPFIKTYYKTSITFWSNFNRPTQHYIISFINI
jgi:hypothetical protein